MSEQDPDQIGGWVAPSSTLYDLCRLPEIRIPRDGSVYPRNLPSPLTRRQRVMKQIRRLPYRARTAREAFREAWRNPDGWWEAD